MKALQLERKTDFSFYACHCQKIHFVSYFKTESQLDDSLAKRLSTSHIPQGAREL